MGNDGNPLNNVENSFLALLLSVLEIDFVQKWRNVENLNVEEFFRPSFAKELLVNETREMYKFITQFSINNLIRFFRVQLYTRFKNPLFVAKLLCFILTHFTPKDITAPIFN